MVLAGVVLATLAAAAAMAIVLLQPARPADQIVTPSDATTPAPPTTRAPISVSPETRAPFPNQAPPRNNDQRGGGGGLLGGLL
jgi:hypothetical protein